MARQKSEDRIRPQGRRKATVTQGVECPGGGKAVPVNEQAKQLELRFETAEETERERKVADGEAVRHRRRSATRAEPKSKSKNGKVLPATMEEVVERLSEAFHNVAWNQGAPGPDGQNITEVREHLGEILPRLSVDLLEGEVRAGQHPTRMDSKSR
jgi:hypothetical protein